MEEIRGAGRRGMDQKLGSPQTRPVLQRFRKIIRTRKAVVARDRNPGEHPESPEKHPTVAAVALAINPALAIAAIQAAEAVTVQPISAAAGSEQQAELQAEVQARAAVRTGRRIGTTRCTERARRFG